MLGNKKNAAVRVGASYALFEIAISDETLGEEIRDELVKTHKSSQPYRRIAAARTLEMINIVNFVNDVYTSPKEIEQINM